jgi:hypothetical protein
MWPLESARAHGGLTELGSADLTDTQIWFAFDIDKKRIETDTKQTKAPLAQ